MPIKKLYKKVFLDTNTLIYQTFSDYEISKHKAVNQQLKYFIRNKYSIFISTQVLKEFFAISTNGKIFKIPLTIEQSVKKINEFTLNFDIVYETSNVIATLNKSLLKYKQDKQRIYDTNLVAIMMEYNIQNLFTFNVRDFEKFSEIKLIEVVEN